MARKIKNQINSKNFDLNIDFALELGVENAFVQEGETAEESFIPEFNGEGVE